MRYKMLLWPHANARYQSETVKLAAAELELMLRKLAPGAAIAPDEALGAPCLDIALDGPLPEIAVEAVRGHSLLYALFEDRGGLLAPVVGRAEARVGSDLPAILKYKGKTNELFLKLLANVALYSGDFWPRREEPLSLLDPMCGRATGLFVAANCGWDAVGADVDKNDLKEAERFFKRYLEYHRFKHAVTRASRTLAKGSAAECRFEYAADAHAERRTLSLLNLDAGRADGALGKNGFHLITCDLPYGVRHDAQLAKGERAGGNWLEALLERALPSWRIALKPGGAVALSFNAQNTHPRRLRALLANAGFEVVEGGPYDGLSHWVEQAITRDVVVGRKS